MSAPISVVDQISASMSLSSLRHQVIASNIANRDTEGYQRLSVKFDNAMGNAQAVAVAAEKSTADVSLEQDLVAMSANSMQYEAMARVLNRYFSIIATIASSNRG